MTQPEQTHPGEADLLAAIHREDVAGSGIREHIAQCERCAERTQLLSDEDLAVAALLRVLDHPAPVALPGLPLARLRRGRLRRAMLVAGPGALLAIAAAAAVLPRSPVRQWMHRGNAAAAVAPSATTIESAAPLASAIAVVAPKSLVVEFRREQLSGVIELSRSSGTDVGFRSRGGTTAYQVAAGRVVIDNQVAAEAYLIDLPATVQEIQILVDHRLLMRWPADSSRFAVSQHPQLARVFFTRGAIP